VRGEEAGEAPPLSTNRGQPPPLVPDGP
jgi:hypothetical protein